MSARVLVVDDSPILRLSIRRAVTQAGVENENIFEAGNGREALDFLRDNTVDLILLDLNMPVMDGETFMRVLSTDESRRDVMVVVVSTESNQKRLAQLEGLGVRGYLHKPFEPEELCELTGGMLARPDLDPLTTEQVSEAVAGALESIAFMLLDGAETEEQSYSQHTRIEYSGSHETSEVRLSATDGFLLELASNLIGVDISEVSPELEGTQALSELANIVCGEVVRVLGGTDSSFRMGLPESIQDGVGLNETTELVECQLESEGEFLRVTVARQQR